MKGFPFLDKSLWYTYNYPSVLLNVCTPHKHESVISPNATTKDDTLLRVLFVTRRPKIYGIPMSLLSTEESTKFYGIPKSLLSTEDSKFMTDQCRCYLLRVSLEDFHS